MKRLFYWHFWFIALAGTSLADAPEPSAYHTFENKQGVETRARILSISDDLTELNIERIDGNTFTLEITLLSLADQAFIQKWMKPKPEKGSALGKIAGFGQLPSGDPVNMAPGEGVEDFVQLGALKEGWIGRRASGELVSQWEKYAQLGPVNRIKPNTVWLMFSKPDGTLWDRQIKQVAPEVTNAVFTTAGSRHNIAVLGDGTVRVWGPAYENPEVHEPPYGLTDIVHAAASQGSACAIASDGTVYGWTPKSEAVYTAKPGDGIVYVEAGIFTYVGITKSGEVYAWGSADPGKAKRPRAIEEGERFLKIRSNGDTKAAQREDGTWLAWGANGAGIVDHINSLPPTEEIAFFSEPGKKDHGYVVWLEAP